ncbi:NACHT domain-containing protein [Sphingomonas lenta]|uniref:NACHT domain-containing protein n=1 Tax=Sphingomonas lenta TaxID=1141887 RepID=A0A2A2SGH3_9SPHN|nr:NACHT domain-containing protein [Sphingomonas lenta]PAX08394.1 hypothetical protein CKY28_11640 [Sphingomonas lenta]
MIDASSQKAENKMPTLENALITAAAKQATGPAATLAQKLGTAAYNKVAKQFAKTFSGHLDSSQNRCSRVKNILYRDQSVYLRDQYVNVNFGLSRHHSSMLLTDVEVAEQTLNGSKFCISGTAGAGKTMFMKWLTLFFIDVLPSSGRIPLFLELRYLSELEANHALSDILRQKTSSQRGMISNDLFVEALKSGQFIIVLDAIDEVHHNFRDRVVTAISDFARLYPDCPMVLSTRPSDQVESLQEFTVVHTQPMSSTQIVDVLKRLAYDQDVKQRLISELNAGLFSRHSEFLSNPLLATIMLLTFDHSADIPTKRSSFYKAAFETLYQRHDAAKGMYRRGHYAGLPMDEFERVFSFFCYRTFSDSNLEFSNAELLRLFREAADISDVDARAEDLVKDAIESVCLLQHEGLDIVFVHRSFQEYFTALFVSRYKEDDLRELISQVYGIGYSTLAFSMLVELNKQSVETSFIMPRLREWLSDTQRIRINTKSGLAKMIDLTWGSFDISFETGDVVGCYIDPGTMGDTFSTIEDFWDDNFGSNAIFATTPTGGRSASALQADPVISRFTSFKKALTRTLVREHEDDEEAGEKVIFVSAEDAEWLIHTPLPERLANVRLAAKEFVDRLERKHTERKSAIRRIRQAAQSLDR